MSKPARKKTVTTAHSQIGVIGDHTQVEGGINYIFNYSTPAAPASSAHDGISPCPYKGLFPFGPTDVNYFFGREKVTAELIQLTNKRIAVPILGASGSGKSSLVLAGLVPALQQRGGWRFVHFRPGSDPFLALAKALILLYEPTLSKADQAVEAGKIADHLHDGKLTIADIIEGIQREMKAHERLLLIADQFEELFTHCLDEKIRHQFLDNLVQCCQPLDSPHSPLVIVFTLRSDFLTVALNNLSFAEVLRVDVKLGPMTQVELEQAIEGPAQKLGVRFEEGLVERIRQAVENKPGNLPLLEFALSLLWEKRTGEQIIHDAYEAIGQVEGALARHANEQYDRLSESEKELTQYIFTQLVHPGRGTEDTRQIAIMNELDKKAWPVIRKLADLRLVATSQNAEGQETVEVVHEALIQHWGKLEDWMNKIREFRIWQEQLRFELKRWHASGQDEGALLRGTFLAEAREWLKERLHDLREAEHDFIQAGIKQHAEEQQEKKDAERNRLVLEIKVQGGADLDLQKANLERANLERANLERANLERANLQEANLQEANLEGANLEGANLEGANLQEAILYEANLEEANLQGANLQGANLQGANLQGANLERAILQGADLARAILQGADLERAILQGGNLPVVNLQRANLQGVNLQGVNLQRANLQEANLQEADLEGVNLQRAHLEGAILEGVNLEGANLQGAILYGANLYGAILQKANLYGVNLYGANLQKANLEGAILQGANLEGANLQGANLQGVNLDGANLDGVNLDGAQHDSYTRWPYNFHVEPHTQSIILKD